MMVISSTPFQLFYTLLGLSFGVVLILVELAGFGRIFGDVKVSEPKVNNKRWRIRIETKEKISCRDVAVGYSLVVEVMQAFLKLSQISKERIETRRDGRQLTLNPVFSSSKELF